MFCLVSYLKLSFSWLLIYISISGCTVNGWLSLWLLMEITLVVFMGLLAVSSCYSVAELMMKYYVIQVLAGLVLATCIVLNLFIVSGYAEWWIVLMLMIKLGLAPFHFWMISILGKMGWLGVGFTLSVVKLLPVLALSYFAEFDWLGPLAAGSVVVGSLLGINEGQIQKLLGYSSMVNIGWLLLAGSLGMSIFFFFFFGYSFMMVLFCSLVGLFDVYYVNQFKLAASSLEFKVWIFLLGVSFSGIPPFLGFVLKWVLSCLVFYGGFVFFLFLLVMFSLFSIVYYLQLWYYFMFVYGLESKWYSFSLISFIWSFFYCFLVFSFLFFYIFI